MNRQRILYEQDDSDKSKKNGDMAFKKASKLTLSAGEPIKWSQHSKIKFTNDETDNIKRSE